MKKITATLIIAGVLMLSALTVAYAAYPSLTTGYAVDSDYHGINVPPNTPVHVTAYTTDAGVYQVTFKWHEPNNGPVAWIDEVTPGTLDGQYDGKDVYTFASTHSPNVMGDWGVQAFFQSPDGKTKAEVDFVISIKATSFFVIPDVPVLGTVGSLAAMLLGLGIYIKRKR